MPLKTSEPSGTLQSICTRTFRNLPEYLNLTDYLHGKPPQPHQVSASEPSKTSQGTVSAPEPTRTSPFICNGTSGTSTRYLWGSGYLHRNPPEHHHLSAMEPSGTSTGHLHRNPFGTLRNFARNLLLKLHRIAPELIWAKDPIAKFIKFCC